MTLLNTTNLNTSVPLTIKFDFLDVRIIKKIVKILDYTFSLRESYNKYSEKRQFRSYVKSLEKKFSDQKIRAVFHSETGFYPLPSFLNIITVYDLTPILFPELHRAATVDLHLRKIRFAKNDAQLIIAISESTRRDLLTHFGDSYKKPIVVAYPGLDSSFVSKLEGPKIGVKSKRYLLFYGTFDPRKNIAYVVRAFTELYNAGEIPSDYRFVLIGGKGWGKTKENIISYISEQFPIATERPVVVLDYATDQNLKSYIKHARAVLYPSLYEGFGLPVLESMSLGTPVLTSNTSSMPEVGGDAAMYINPKDFFEIKAKIKTIVEDDKMVSVMSRGIIQ
jgi:glycosyltransferase involved in cell wall biosynthesis